MSDFDTKNDDDGDYNWIEHTDEFGECMLLPIGAPIGSRAIVKEQDGTIVEYEKTECGWVA